jgi:UDP-N-acetylmuramate--alanine ligase
VTSIDADHLDIYGSHDQMRASFSAFASQTKAIGTLIYKNGLQLDAGDNGFLKVSYGIEDNSICVAENVRIENGAYLFDLSFTPLPKWPDKKVQLKNLVSVLPGRHNVENAVAACAAAITAGVPPEKLKPALASFKGVKRRFEYHIKTDQLVLIDDYAHHPEELRACISGARELYPSRKLTGVFQPHLFSRTRDFADEFAVSLGLLDEIILLPIYPAREKPIPGIDSQWLLDKIHKPSKILVEKSGLLGELKSRQLEVVLMLGAGDIDALVEPVRQALSSR